jgi:hypothetical protein
MTGRARSWTAAAAAQLLCTALLLACGAAPAAAGAPNTIAQLRGLMYRSLSAVNGCYKLLNVDGPIGCEDVGQRGVEAPLALPASLGDDLSCACIRQPAALCVGEAGIWGSA